MNNNNRIGIENLMWLDGQWCIVINIIGIILKDVIKR